MGIYTNIIAIAQAKINKYGSTADIYRNGVLIGSIALLKVEAKPGQTSPLLDANSSNYMTTSEIDLQIGDSVDTPFNVSISAVNKIAPNGLDVIYYDIIGTNI